jgi:hypothetical protein
MPAITLNLTLLLAAIASIGFATGCGEDRSNLVPGDTARQIDADLEQVKQLVRDGNCFEALATAEEVREVVESLGSEVDPTLRLNLLDGVTRLQIKVQDNCEEADSEPAVEVLRPDLPAEDTGAVEPEPTSPTGQAGTGTTPTPEPTPEPAPVPVPTPVPPDNGSGGVSPPTGGIAPPTGGS